MNKGNKYIYIILVICSLHFSKARAHTAPIAEFSTLTLCFGDSSRFINQSIGGVNSMWIIQKWDIALNDTITVDTLYTTDLTYLFTLQGIYYITLQEDNGHIVSITKEITIGNNTKADFSFQSCTNKFVNMSSCSTSFLWDFGDGITSTAPIPIHQYADTGTYIVTLIVYNGTTTDTATNSITITVLGYAHPVYQITVSNDTVYCKITGSIWSASNLTWYFSDGTTATSIDTFHVFRDTSSCNVTIRVYNNCGMFLRDTLLTINNVATSIKEHQITKSHFIIYPNPASDSLTIVSEKIESITIFDLQGKIEFTINPQPIISHLKIDVSKFKNGMYTTQIKTNDKVYIEKFIKE